MTKSAELDIEIKELESKLGSLKAEQQLLKAQESLNKKKQQACLKMKVWLSSFSNYKKT